MPMQNVQARPAGAFVRTDTTRQRVFLTFASGDLAQARPVAAGLLASGGISLDQALTSEPFASARGDIIRASLLTRLSHCASALCLYGARTTDDAWVRWALETAVELRLPTLGAALPGAAAGDSEHFLTRLGVELVPLNRDAIVTRTSAFSVSSPARGIDAASIAETLHLMRHPLR
jgi:hypothetical protein